MNDERIIGELKEFKRATEKRLEKLEATQAKGFEDVQNEIRSIQKWRWKKTGETGIIAALVSAAAVLISKKLGG